MLKAARDYNMVFRETFVSASSVQSNGGVIVGTPIINHGLSNIGITIGNSVNYPKNFDFFWREGGSLRLKLKLLPIDSTFQRVFFLGTDVNHFISIAINSSTGATICEFKNGGANQFYLVNPATQLGTNVELVFTWSPSPAMWRCYLNGVASGADSIPGTASLGSYPTNYGVLSFGNLASGKFLGVFSSCELFKGVVFTAEEVKDLYEGGTVPEILNPLIDLPLRSWYHKENGQELLVDGDMEAADTTAWSAAGVDTAKVAGTRPDGTGSQVMRVTRTGSTGCAFQNVAATGKKYKITGWARSVDGIALPHIFFPLGQIIWQGTASTSWQYFAVEAIAGNITMGLYAGASIGNVAEYDDISVQLMEAYTINKGSLGGAAKLGDGSTLAKFPTQLSPHGMFFDGNDYIDVTDLDWSTLSAFSVCGYVREVNLDGDRVIFSGNSATKSPMFRVGSGGNLIAFWSNASLAPTNYTPFGRKRSFTYLVTFDNATKTVAVYIDGRSFGPPRVMVGGLDTSSNNLRIGARAETNCLVGKQSQVKVYPYVLTPLQAKLLHNKLIKELQI